MYFLLNDAVFILSSEELSSQMLDYRFGAFTFDCVRRLGQELFSEQPALQHTHPERAIRLCALIRCKEPSVNAALFVAPSPGCRPRDVGVRVADLDLATLARLQIRHALGSLTPAFADSEVWQKLAA